MSRPKESIEKSILRVKDDPNFKQIGDSCYYASRFGEVYRSCIHFDKKMHPYLRNGKDDECGNMYIYKIGGKRYNASRLVYETFKGKLPDNYVLWHKNGMAMDWSLTNLVPLERSYFAKKKANEKRRRRRIYCPDTGKIYSGWDMAVKHTGYSKSMVYDVCQGKVKNPTVRLEYVVDEEY